MSTTTKRKPEQVNRILGNGKHEAEQQAVIKPLKQKIATFELIGGSPYMQARFSKKAMNKIIETQKAGQQSRSKKVREARNFEDDYEQAKHKFADGTCGIPASAFRKAMISACRTVGFAMTLAKLSIFVESDGLDAVDATPLVKIHGKPEMSIMAVRNASGVCDMRARPVWKEWTCTVRVRFDEDQFSLNDVANLLHRVGCQVGIGEGRYDSKESAGMGFGCFRIKQ